MKTPATDVSTPNPTGTPVSLFESAIHRSLALLKDNPNPGGAKAADPKHFMVGAVTDNKKAEEIAAVMATHDPEAIKRLNDPNLADISNTGVPLANIASITQVSPNVLELKTRDGRDIVIVKQMTPYLFDAMAGKAGAVEALNKSKAEGYRIAQAGDVPPGMNDYKAIGPADEVGPGLIRYETWSGDKVIVSNEVNHTLFDQVKNDQQTLALINDSEKEGYHLASADQPADGLKLIGTPEELGHGLIRYETESGEKVIVSQAATPNLYASMVKVSDGIFGVDGAADTSWIDNSKYASGVRDWDTLTGNKGGAKPTEEEKNLERPRAAAKMLSDNWDKWGLHDRKVDFANPPSDLPPEAQAVLKYLAGSPSLMNALDSGGLGKSDGVITRAEVDRFISQSNKDLSAASSAYGKFLSNNPDASELAKANAKSAAIVMANISLVSSAGPQMQGEHQRANNGSLTTDNLAAIHNDPGLSLELSGAAGYWSNPGMLHVLDSAGDLPATATSDGIVQQKNLRAWLENQAPKDDHGVLMMLSNASIRGSLADVDTSKLTQDILEHPENYDGKTKAAAMLELSDARARLASSDKVDGGGDLYAGITADSQYHLNPTKSKLLKQLDDAAAKLAADPDVKTFLAGAQGPGMRDIVNSDPAIKQALQHSQDTRINSGDIINTSLAAKGADGQPVTLPEALSLAGTDATLTDLALGGDGKVDLAAIAEKSGKSGDIEQYFREHILNGKDLDDALAKGGDPLAAIGQFGSQAALFSEFLGDRVSPQDASDVQQRINQALSQTLIDGATDDALKDIFGDGSGNFDEAKVTAIIEKAMADDPDMFKDASGTPIRPQDVVSLMRSVWDLNRQGEKISDALPKAIDGMKLNVGEAYKQGLLHIGSALLAGGVLAARSSTGGNSPTDNASRVSAGMQFAGLIIEGGTKYAKEAGYGMVWKPTPIDPSKPQGIGDFPTGKMVQNADGINRLGNLGKIVGGAGSFIGGVLGLISGVNSAFAGDKVNAGFSLTTGALGTGAAITSIIEGGAGLFGLADVGAIAGAFSGVLGWATAGVGLIAGIVFPIIEVAHREKQQDQFFGALKPVVDKYGLDGGPITEDDRYQEYLF
ncbi:type III effector HrpK domain-containing protein [Pseudomonas entomophila]|uniref:type III effector HrpK domain-containing protein n=1 Tax=Pseudomonas entomophila TaxID=312306 RepID=UPI0023D8BE20|nr:type III effector HrpK domain-containing protein [Pseudomonas entomophila]MDF0733626.1 type III effector HrpK domain-containing protein [Pseudomonas entomophila]